MAIAQVGGTQNANAGSVTTLAATYSPTNGNTMVVFVMTGGAVTGLTVQDSAANLLSAGPVSGNLACFYQLNIPAAITSYTANWTTGQQASICIEEYSGAAAIDLNFSGNVAAATSGTASLSIAIPGANDWIVCGAADNASNTLTVATGNSRQKTTTSTTRLILMDNTSATAGTSVTCSATLTSSAWNEVGITLGQTSKARTDQDLTLAVKLPTSAKARVDHDITLAVKKPSSTKARVGQDVVLALYKRPFGNATQLQFWTQYPDTLTIIKRSSGLYQSASVPVFVVNKMFPIVFCVT